MCKEHWKVLRRQRQAFAAYKMGKQTLKGVFQWIMALSAFLLIVVFGLNAVWVILGAIVAGEVYAAINAASLAKEGKQ